jgi:hypothetical protein
MRALPSSVTVRSRGLWPAILTLSLASLASSMAGCIWSDGGSSSGSEDPPTVNPPTLDTPKQVAITPDKTLKSDAGAGVGIFAEYASGGHWHVWTTCDTNTSKVSCDFEAFAIPQKGAQISNVKGEHLEGSDVAEALTDGSAHLSTSTSTEFDGMTFDADPGAVVELEVYFEGVPDARIVYWFGDDTLHTGAPTDPIDFVPAAP